MARQLKLQHDLAAVLGLTQQSVSQRMLGRTPFRAEELVAIAEWLGVSMSQFTPAPAAPERVA